MFRNMLTEKPGPFWRYGLKATTSVPGQSAEPFAIPQTVVDLALDNPPWPLAGDDAVVALGFPIAVVTNDGPEDGRRSQAGCAVVELVARPLSSEPP